jgi:hypothetical protein
VVRGASGSLLLTLESPQGKALSALQWEFTFPQNVVVDLADINAGSAAESAQKALTCMGAEQLKDTGKGSVYVCILAGGQKPIPNGPIAVVRYRVPLEVPADRGKSPRGQGRRSNGGPKKCGTRRRASRGYRKAGAEQPANRRGTGQLD